MEEQLRIESEEDVQEILNLAIRKDSQGVGDLRKRMTEIARELGISEEALELATAEHLRESGIRKDLAAFQAHLRRGFFRHIVPYVLVNAMFMVMCLTSTPRESWFVFPLLGWGIGVSMHAYRAYIRPAEATDPEFLTWRALRNAKLPH